MIASTIELVLELIRSGLVLFRFFNSGLYHLISKRYFYLYYWAVSAMIVSQSDDTVSPSSGLMYAVSNPDPHVIVSAA